MPTAAKSKATPKPKAKGKASPKPKAGPKAKAVRGRKGKACEAPVKKTARPTPMKKTPSSAAKKARAPVPKGAAKPRAKAKAAKELKSDTNNRYSRAYHAAKRKGLSKEEAGHGFLNLMSFVFSNWSLCCMTAPTN